MPVPLERFKKKNPTKMRSPPVTPPIIHTPPPPVPVSVSLRHKSQIIADPMSSVDGYCLASDYDKTSKPPGSVVFGVISLGGSLYGTYNPNTCVLTDGDVQQYWEICNIPPTEHPTVMVVPLQGITPVPDGFGTNENTIDVSVIGACCPGSNVTIILYVAPNTVAGLIAAFTAAIKADVISCAWGAPEAAYDPGDINTLEALFLEAKTAGIPVCVAGGDYPSTSPHVIACEDDKSAGVQFLIDCMAYVYSGTSIVAAAKAGTFYTPK